MRYTYTFILVKFLYSSLVFFFFAALGIVFRCEQQILLYPGHEAFSSANTLFARFLKFARARATSDAWILE